MEAQSPPTIFEQIQAFAGKLHQSDEVFVRQQAIGALNVLATHAAFAALTLDELVNRDVRLSSQLAGFRLVLQMLAAGNSKYTVGLEPGTFDLQNLCMELAQSIDLTQPLPEHVEKAPEITPEVSGNVYAVDFKNRKRS